MSYFVDQEKTNNEMCPVTALCEYCKLRGPGEGPLFCFMDKTPISRQFFTSQLQLSLKWCNTDIRNYKGHSFRIGSASHASSTGTGSDGQQLVRFDDTGQQNGIVNTVDINETEFIDDIHAEDIVGKLQEVLVKEIDVMSLNSDNDTFYRDTCHCRHSSTSFCDK